MQVANSPFSSSLPHPHYHSYYQLQPPGPHDHELKRQYLALLPPQQIIEICLTFDIHVPPYVKSTVWPPDINAAIAGLRRITPSSSAEKLSDEGSKDVPAIMDSLKSPPPETSTTSQSENAPATEPQPPDKGPPKPDTPVDAVGSTEGSAQAVQSTEGVSQASSAQPRTATPVPDTQTPPAPIGLPAQPIPPPPPTYPHQPYGYGPPQAAYPHTPYYPSHPAGYPYGYGYPPMHNGYQQQPTPPGYPPQPTPYNSIVSVSAQPPQPEGGLDDLPSYEEMIVEALTDCTDPEGRAPKDLFTWMASRYPLQSNFRPSASQALQKAFKRGRFEKSSNGRYRLNATWEGGNTSRRTTRRPQTQNSQPSTSSGNTAANPPFTHAPLVHHHHSNATPSHPTPQPTYPGQPYGYQQYPGYPGYNPAPQQAAPSAAVVTTSSSPSYEKVAATGEAAAYEAAQNILKAINFGGLLTLPPEEQEREYEPIPPQVGSGVEQLLSHVQAALANNATGNTPQAPVPLVPAPSSDPRAELQAQLALLAAQLAELSQTEDSTAIATSSALQIEPPSLPMATPPPPPIQPLSAPLPLLPPHTYSTATATALPPDEAVATLPAIPPATTVAALQVTVVEQTLQPEGQIDEDSDDDDMEEII